MAFVVDAVTWRLGDGLGFICLSTASGTIGGANRLTGLATSGGWGGGGGGDGGGGSGGDSSIGNSTRSPSLTPMPENIPLTTPSTLTSDILTDSGNIIVDRPSLPPGDPSLPRCGTICVRMYSTGRSPPSAGSAFAVPGLGTRYVLERCASGLLLGEGLARRRWSSSQEGTSEPCRTTIRSGRVGVGPAGSSSEGARGECGMFLAINGRASAQEAAESFVSNDHESRWGRWWSRIILRVAREGEVSAKAPSGSR